jgi:hypothetical protein
MPSRRKNTKHINKKDNVALKFVRDDAECEIGVTGHGRRIQTGDHSKSKVQDVKYQKEKKKRA